MEEREYGKTPLNENELKEIIGDGPIGNFLNTRTSLYRERKMKDKPPGKAEAIRLMLTDQNLLKRPVTIKGETKILGFDESALLRMLRE